MKLAREKRLERAQLKVLFTVPFFAPAVARLPVVWDASIPTACTDGKRIRWNPVWFDSLPDPVLVTLLAHEAGHCLFGHLWRAPSGVEVDLWNQACDHALNLMLKAFAANQTEQGLADPFPFPTGGNYCCDPAFADMPEERIYSLLLASRNKTTSPGNGQGQGNGNGSGAGQSGQQGQQASQGQRGSNGGQPGKGQGPSPFGEFEVPQTTPGTEQAASEKELRQDWEHALTQSVAAGKRRGYLPGGFARMVGDFLNPRVPWWELLRNWLREKSADHWDWMKPDPHFVGSGFILPSLESEKIGCLVFGKDTSGSIDPETLSQFVGEQQTCLDDLRPGKLVDICCDAQIQQVREYLPGETIDRSAPGGGGTDFRPFFAHAETMEQAPKAMIILTDLQGTFPDEAPAYPVLWVVWGGATAAPFGEVIPTGD